jgi:hypothetical protein
MPPSPIYAGLKYIVVAYILSLAFWLQLAGPGMGCRCRRGGFDVWNGLALGVEE